MEIKAKLIKFILSFTDYDRVKKENKILKSDISTLIENPYSIESYLIIEKYKMERQIHNMFWMGDAGVKLDRFDGIVTHMTI